MARIKTKTLDVVYFVSEFARSDLIYSIRSVVENLEFNRLWIYGGLPTGIKPDRYECRKNQKGATKWARVRNMYRDVCENNEITDDFILFHDDFFILKHTSEFVPEYLGTLIENAENVEKNYGNKPTEYTILLRETAKTLKNAGYSAKSYELHTPFVFNRKKMIKILNDYPKSHCIRSIYANVYGIGGEKAHDVKIAEVEYKELDKIIGEWRSVSTSNESWRVGDIGEWLRNRFVKPSRYEITDVL